MRADLKFLRTFIRVSFLILVAACSSNDSQLPGRVPPASPGLERVNHIIIVMMENHSFDNYFGALAYAPGSPYHTGSTGCAPDDHGCVDGLTCSVDSTGALVCNNSNLQGSGNTVVAFHNPNRCVSPDLDHTWVGSHREANFDEPNAALLDSPNDGFIRVNEPRYVSSPHEEATMGFYTQEELPFYYDLAQKFAMNDRYFSSVLGPTLPNRLFLMAATSFGHVATGDRRPPEGFKPIGGTIFDLLDGAEISWANYSQASGLQAFLASAAGSPGSEILPQVSFVDPTLFGPEQNDEHPPTDIQRGQAFVSQVVNAVRNGPYWQDSVIFITYDEHGGFYDHVAPPRALQGSALTPDGIFPGQCADLSNPPASLEPGGGASCDRSAAHAAALCPDLAQDPGGAYPSQCASFDQLGFRVPFLVVSPFAKPHYVSHTSGDHTSILAFVEERFLNGESRAHLTLRDQYADPLMDLFDFEDAPSMNTPVIQAEPPVVDCTPLPSEGSASAWN